ncbi:MAG TPA: SUF system Fe-S cluster assembly protein [Gemmatales bacterium]|nr:SUF system Fe-S cluster assembly protein [Gemmatales bacterium]
MTSFTHLGMGKISLQAASNETSVKDDPSLPLHERVINATRSVYDPEIPVNIYELGLIYDIKIDDTQHVDVQMTLTSPACPVAGSIVKQVEDRIAALPGVKSARVQLVWDPPWGKERMSEAARLELGFF